MFMRSRIILCAILIVLFGCGKKSGPTSPDIWPPHVSEIKGSRNIIYVRFNEPIISDGVDLKLISNEGDTIKPLDIISDNIDYSISIYLDSSVVFDSLYFMMNSVKDSSLNEMKQYEKYISLTDTTIISKFRVKNVNLNHIANKRYNIIVEFSMPVKDTSINIIFSPFDTSQSKCSRLTNHSFIITLTDTPVSIILPQSILSYDKRTLDEPYKRYFKKVDFIKRELNVKFENLIDSFPKYIMFITDSLIDYTGVSSDMVLDSVFSESCTVIGFANINDDYLVHTMKNIVPSDTIIRFIKYDTLEIRLFWNNIIDKVGKEL